MSDCKHLNFSAVADIHRLTKRDDDDTVVAFVAKFTIRCADCGKPFEFNSPKDSVRSLDREQLSINIKPSCGVATPFRTRVHVADKPEDGKQKCFRCDTVLAQSGGAWHNTGDQSVPHNPFWGIGAYVGIAERADGDPTNPVSLFLMDHDASAVDEIHCTMPG